MPTYRLLIFDLDGTLVDSLADLALSVNQVLQQMGYEPLPHRQIFGYIGQGARWLLSQSLQAAGAFSEEALATARSYFLDIYRHQMLQHTTFFPQAQSTLRSLQKQGHLIALCTNKPYALTETLLHHLQAWDTFRLVLGGDSLPERKPSPLPLLHICKELGIPPQESLMIGDSEYDVRAGHAAQMDTCGVTFGTHSPQEVLAHSPTYLIDALPQLLDLQAHRSLKTTSH